MYTRYQLAGIVSTLGCVTAVVAALQFPMLTGRVVDEAGILSPAFESEITAQLAAHEHTTNQVVVATVKSLQEYDIADYANQLFRHWGIAQKDKNNGVLLIVAPNERKMRIEVGYGLEGVLTDAISRDIIERRIKPQFRQQDFEQGIRDGVDAILAAIGGEYQTAAPPISSLPANGGSPDYRDFIFIPIIFAGFGLMFAAHQPLKNRKVRLMFAPLAGGGLGTFGWMMSESVVIAIALGIFGFLLSLFVEPGRGGSSGWGSGGGWSGGSSGGGGFSGGGGSSGGGGASGSW